jgi:hypothetical protein
MFTKLKRFADWFDFHLGWFFTNGNKMDARRERLRKTFNENGERIDG